MQWLWQSRHWEIDAAENQQNKREDISEHHGLSEVEGKAADEQTESSHGEGC